MKTAHEAISAMRAEIERRISISREKFLHLEDGPAKDYHEGRASGLCGLLALLDTLEAEEKEMDSEKDFEKEIDKTVNECTNGYDFDWEKFARHFYELGLNSKK